MLCGVVRGPVSYALQHVTAEGRWQGPLVARPCGWRIGSAAPRGLVRLFPLTATGTAGPVSSRPAARSSDVAG